MASTATITIAKLGNLWVVKDADAGNTPELDIAAGPCELLHVYAAGTITGSEVEYLKLYDQFPEDLSAGSTDPDFCFALDATGVLNIALNSKTRDGKRAGHRFEKGLNFLASGEPGTAVSTAPNSTITVVLTIRKVG